MVFPTFWQEGATNPTRHEAFGGFKGRSEVPPLIDDYEVGRSWMFLMGL
jgi:hypothetical protein